MAQLLTKSFCDRLGIHSPTALVQRFLSIFIPGLILLSVAAWVSIKLAADTQIQQLEVRQSARIAIAKGFILHEFEIITAELRLLSNAPAFLHYIESGGDRDKKSTIRLFQVFAQELGPFDQVRFINAKGKEVIRVNMYYAKATLVPDTELQDKSGRYYFKDTIRLSPGQIYVSPFDLNIEHGQIEVPYKPMIRLGTPIVDSKGNKIGILLLNYLGTDLIHNFLKFASVESTSQSMLLNGSGYWMSGPKPSDEWGFMFNNNRKFGTDFPEEWREISHREEGTLLTRHGLFSFSTIHPLGPGLQSSTGSSSAAGESPRFLGSHEYSWKIVLFIPAKAISATNLIRDPITWILFPLAILLWISASAVIAFTLVKRKQIQEALTKSEATLRKITTTMGEGLIVLDEGGRVSFTNPEACKLLGYEKEEMLGVDAHSLYHYKQADGNSYPPEHCPILETIKTGKQNYSLEETFWRKDGSMLPVLVSAAPMEPGSRGFPTVVAFRDITDQKESELALKNAFEEITEAHLQASLANQQLETLNNELERLSLLDPLTKVANRRRFNEYLDHVWRSAVRSNTPLSLIMIDVDEFKAYNDNYGHLAGDECLISVATALARTIHRPDDLIARYGGEEFVVVLPDTDTGGAKELAEKLRIAVEELDIVHSTKTGNRVTISLGIATAKPGLQNSSGMLIASADAGLYEAKRRGRNRTEQGTVPTTS